MNDKIKSLNPRPKQSDTMIDRCKWERSIWKCCLSRLFNRWSGAENRQLRARRVLMLFKHNVFRWEPEGRYRCTKSMAIAPFWFSNFNGTSLKSVNVLLVLSWVAMPRSHCPVNPPLHYVRPSFTVSMPTMLGFEWFSQLAGLQWLTVLSMLIRGITVRWLAYANCYPSIMLRSSLLTEGKIRQVYVLWIQYVIWGFTKMSTQLLNTIVT